MTFDAHEWVLRRDMIRVARRLAAQGFFPGTSGNLSARLSAGRVLITPSGIPKSRLQPEELLIIHLDGEVEQGMRGLRPTTETPMHLEVYRQRPEVAAVVHAHPAAAVALTLAEVSLEEPTLPEVLLLLGPVPTTAYATPSSEENRLAIADLIRDHDVLLLARHGSLTVGRSLDEAAQRLEVLEHAAHTLLWAHMLGAVAPLPAEALSKLAAIRQAYLDQAPPKR